MLQRSGQRIRRQIIAVGEVQRRQRLHLAGRQVGLQDDVVEVLAVVDGEEGERRRASEHVDQRLRRQMRGGDVETGDARRLPIHRCRVGIRDS